MTEVPVLPCCGALAGDDCGCVTSDTSAGEMEQLLRERRPIVMAVGPAAQAAMAAIDATHPLLIAMRAAAVDHYDASGLPRRGDGATP